MDELETPTRETGSVLGPIERPLLQRLARAVPAWVGPDILTLLGLVGAAITAVAYVLCNFDVDYLWLASLGLVVNWYGDSLDGTLARVRHIERPRYGFVVDHTTDLAAQMLIGFGMGISPFLRFDVACILLIVYLAFAAFTFMKTAVSGELQISFGGVGPTEVRCALIAGNILMLWYRPVTLVVLWEPMTAIDLAALTASVAGIIGLVFIAVREMRRIGRSELSR